MAKKRPPQVPVPSPVVPVAQVPAPAPAPTPAPTPATPVAQTAAAVARPAVTAERFTRLHRLLQALGTAPRARDWLMTHLGLDVRGFYRDLEWLRSAGITITLTEGRYTLGVSLDTAVSQLPFPDPHLTLGEAQQLARGRSKTHKRLQDEIDQLLS